MSVHPSMLSYQSTIYRQLRGNNKIHKTLSKLIPNLISWEWNGFD